VHELDALMARRETPLGRGQNEVTVRRPESKTGTPNSSTPPPVVTQTTASVPPTDVTAAACVINHRATVHAPDGTPDSRTTIGVCETIVFDVGGRAVDWSADSGWPSARSGRSTFEWAAPERARTSTITATDPGTGDSCHLDMDVIAPAGTHLHNVFELEYPVGTAGAGMELTVAVRPRNVNFGWIATQEDDVPATHVTGYFTARPAAELRHAATPVFARMGWNNVLAPNAAGEPQGDTAATRPRKLPPPWSKGSYHWSIPTRYRCSNSTHAGYVFIYVQQHFAMEDDGTVIVTKGTERVERTP